MSDPTTATAAPTAPPLPLPETCEHNRIDVPYDPCPECRPKYAAAAKAGADLCRASLSAQSGVLS